MEQNIRVHRVGAITSGVSLVGIGLLFILEKFISFLNYEMIFGLWPIILIGLGIEILIANKNSKKFIYDGVAVFIMIMMTGLSVMMAAAEVIMRVIAKWPVEDIIRY